MDERPVAARMQGRAFVPLFFIFCLFYRKEIVFIFGRQGFGKEDAGDGKGTAGKETAGDLGQSGTGGQKIIEQQDVAATDGGCVEMEIGGLVLVLTAFVLFTVMGDGDGIVAVGDTEQAAGSRAEILEAVFVALPGGCGYYHEGKGITVLHQAGGAENCQRDKIGREAGCLTALEFGDKVIDPLFIVAGFMVGDLTGERKIVVQKVTAAAECAYGRMEAGGQRVEMVGNIAYPVIVLIGKLEQEVFGPPACLCLVGFKFHTGQVMEAATGLGTVGIGVTADNIPVQRIGNGGYLYGIGAAEKE